MGEGLGMNMLSRLFSRAVLFGVLLPVLAGCQGGTDAPTLQLQVLEAAQTAIVEKRTGRPGELPLNRAALDTQEDSFLEVTRERRRVTAFLKASLQTRDSQPGEITVWRTDSNETLTTRGGVLVATRGLGGDLLSSSLQLSGRGQAPASGERVLYVRSGDNSKTTLVLTCEVTDLGSETTTIIERKYPTRHVRERCTGGGGTVINDYWIDRGRPRVRQSRQWAGPQIGYLRLRRLTD
jgi:hypothetical protein